MNFHEHLSAFKVLFINLAVTGFVTVANIEMGLKICSVSMALIYTTWKFYHDYKDRKNKQ